MRRKCCGKNRRREDSDEAEEFHHQQAAKAARQTQAQAFWFSGLFGTILLLTALFIPDKSASAYCFVAAAITGGYCVGYCLQWLLLLVLKLPILSANAKSAFRTLEGPLMLAIWDSTLKIAIEVPLKLYVSSAERDAWTVWSNYIFVVAALWLVRRIILRTVLQGLVKKIVGVSSRSSRQHVQVRNSFPVQEQLAKMLFINEGVQRLTDADSNLRDRKAQDKAFKNINNILREATFEEKSHWAHGAFMTVHAPASIFPDAGVKELGKPGSHNMLGTVQSVKLMKIVARLTFQRLVSAAASSSPSSSGVAAEQKQPAEDTAGSVEQFALQAKARERQQTETGRLIPTSSFRTSKPAQGQVAPMSPNAKHMSVTVAAGSSGSNVGSKHMLAQVGAAWAGPLMARMDTSENNSLSEDEFVDGMVRLYNEFYDTKKAALGESPMAGAASVVIDFVNVIILIGCLQTVAGIQLSEFVVTFAAIGLGLSFAVGSSIDACVRAFQLVTIISPFAVGDRVILPGYNDNKIMDVSKVDLLVSEFRDADTGVPVIIPNSEILAGAIKNLSRSALVKAVIVFRFKVSSKMKQSDLDELRDFVLKYLKDRPMDWVAKQRIRLKPDVDGIKVKVKLHHHRSLRASQARDARGDVFVALNDKLREMGLMYSRPVQPVALIPSQDIGWQNAAPSVLHVDAKQQMSTEPPSSGVMPNRLSPLPVAANESLMAHAGGTENPVVFRKSDDRSNP